MEDFGESLGDVLKYKSRTIQYICSGLIFKDIVSIFYVGTAPIVEIVAAVLCYKSTQNLKKILVLPLLVCQYISVLCYTLMLITTYPKQEITYTPTNSTHDIIINTHNINDFILLYWCFYMIILCNVQVFYDELRERESIKCLPDTHE